jgi:hypothetical protein
MTAVASGVVMLLVGCGGSDEGWLKSTEPPSRGVPDEVFGTALYMTTDFESQ